MKRVISLLLALISFILLSIEANGAANSEIGERLSQADISHAREFLSDNGVDLAEPETITNLDSFSLLNYLLDLFKKSILSPGKILVITAALAFISQIAMASSTKAGVNGEVFVIICFITVSPFLIDPLADMLSAVESQHAFMLSYIPIFAGLTAASGNISGAVSYNALVLYAAEGTAFIASAILKPLLMCMLVMSCTQAVNSDILSLTGVLKRFFTAITGAVMTVFVGVIGLQTVVGRTGNEIALKAGKYLVSSFVPIIGMSLAESYRSVSLSLSSIRASVGAVGIVIMIVLLSVPIISMLCYRIILGISGWICSLTGASRLASLMRGLADVYSLCITVLLVYSLMFILSTGIVIMMGSGVS